MSTNEAVSIAASLLAKNRLGKKKCKVCKQVRLYGSNKTGVCTKCQRKRLKPR